MSAAAPNPWRPPLTGVQRRMTRRLAAIVLSSEAPVVLFGAVGARALAEASGGAASTYLWTGMALAAALVVAAGALRTRFGVPLGWLLQLATVACGLVIPAMAVIGIVFGVLWWTALHQGRRLDDMTEAYSAEGVDSA